jgi:hypothetical protein
MSKSSFKKSKKNDYWDNDEEENEVYTSKSRYLEKKKHKIVQKALKTKDISFLTIDEFEDLNDNF